MTTQYILVRWQDARAMYHGGVHKGRLVDTPDVAEACTFDSRLYARRSQRIAGTRYRMWYRIVEYTVPTLEQVMGNHWVPRA